MLNKTISVHYILLGIFPFGLISMISVQKKIGIIFLVCLVSIAIDQGTKLWAAMNLPRHIMTSYLNDLLRIGYVENRGVFLGLGNSLSDEHRFLLFVVLVSAVLLGLLIYLLWSSTLVISELVAYSLILSGGASNVYDRITNNGGVIDFLNVGVGSLRTGIFNVADMAIMLGVCILLVLQFTMSSDSKVPNSSESKSTD